MLLLAAADAAAADAFELPLEGAIVRRVDLGRARGTELAHARRALRIWLDAIEAAPLARPELRIWLELASQNAHTLRDALGDERAAHLVLVAAHDGEPCGIAGTLRDEPPFCLCVESAWIGRPARLALAGAWLARISSALRRALRPATSPVDVRLVFAPDPVIS